MLSISKWPDSSERRWAFEWWQYALDKNLDLSSPEWRQFAGEIRGYFSVDREDVIKFVANGVIDRMQIPES